MLAADLSKAARHPIVEPRPEGERWQRSDIKYLGSYGGTPLCDATISHPLSARKFANAPMISYLLPVFRAAWTAKVSWFRAFMGHAGLGHSLLPLPISTLWGLAPRGPPSRSINQSRHCVSSDVCVREGPKCFVSASRSSAGYEPWIPPFEVHYQCII